MSTLKILLLAGIFSLASCVGPLFLLDIDHSNQGITSDNFYKYIIWTSSLNLSHNSITYIPYKIRFSFLLESLDLSYNPLEFKVTESPFSQMDGLEKLYMVNCSLETLPIIYAPLKLLDIRRNNLKKPEEKVELTISRLDINVILCDSNPILREVCVGIRKKYNNLEIFTDEETLSCNEIMKRLGDSKYGEALEIQTVQMSNIQNLKLYETESQENSNPSYVETYDYNLGEIEDTKQDNVPLEDQNKFKETTIRPKLETPELSKDKILELPDIHTVKTLNNENLELPTTTLSPEDTSLYNVESYYFEKDKNEDKEQNHNSVENYVNKLREKIPKWPNMEFPNIPTFKTPESPPLNFGEILEVPSDNLGHYYVELEDQDKSKMILMCIFIALPFGLIGLHVTLWCVKKIIKKIRKPTVDECKVLVKDKGDSTNINSEISEDPPPYSEECRIHEQADIEAPPPSYASLEV